MTQYRPTLAERVSPPVPLPTEAIAYLLKIYTFENEALFGVATSVSLELNGMGQIAADEWVRSAHAYQGIELDTWLILPDRLEAIVRIREPLGSKTYMRSRKPRLLSSFIANYKAAAAKRINLLRNAPGQPVWQRSYQERLVPDNLALDRVRQLLLKQVAALSQP